MKSEVLFPAGALAMVMVATGAAADVLNFTATIDEAQASACAGTGSTGTGTGVFTLDTDTGEVAYSITFSGLLGTETMAHVHGAAPECINAGIVYALPTGSPKNGTATLTPTQMQDMIDGLHYVNIHTDRDSGGEIRGQILPVDPTYVFGLPHAPLGQAMLALDPSGHLIVSNIGSSGQDGVQTDFGEIEGFSASYDIGPAGAIDPGTSLSIEPMAAGAPVSRSADALGDHAQEVLDFIPPATGDIDVSLTTDDPTLFVTRVVLLQQGRVVLDSDYSSAPAMPIVTGPIGTSGGEPFEVSVSPTADGALTMYRIKVPAAGTFMINGLGAATADEVHLFVPDGAPIRAKVSVKMTSPTGTMVLKGKKILQNFIPHSAQAEARLQGVADLNGDARPDLVVSNIGSSGLDGVVIGLNGDWSAKAMRSHCGLYKIEHAGPPGVHDNPECLIWDIKGSTDGGAPGERIMQPEFGTSSGAWDVSLAPTPWAAPETVTVEVFEFGSPVASVSGLAPGVVATVDTLEVPGVYEWMLLAAGDATSQGIPATGARNRFVWDAPVPVTLPGQSPVTGDELRITAETAPARRAGGALPHVSAQTVDFLMTAPASATAGAALAITGETVDLIDPCPADIDANGAVDILDLLDLLAAWGPCPGCPEDIDGSGTVDIIDLLDLLAAWGACP